MDVQDPHDNDDDMLRISKETLMTTALTLPQAQPWMLSDGDGQPGDQNTWKVVEPYIQDMPIPPKNVKLSDVQVFKALTNKSLTIDQRHDNWPADFSKRGGIKPDQKPTSPTIFIQKGSRYYFLVFVEYYILCGTPCATLKKWLCGSWIEGKFRNKERAKWSYGLAEVPIMARSEPALIIDMTDPQKSGMADIIQFKAMTPSDPSEYDWDYILPNITEISLIYKMAIVQSVTQLNKKTICRTSKKDGTTITTYSYQPDPPAGSQNRPPVQRTPTHRTQTQSSTRQIKLTSAHQNQPLLITSQTKRLMHVLRPYPHIILSTYQILALVSTLTILNDE
jgi:hypothetical protein